MPDTVEAIAADPRDDWPDIDYSLLEEGRPSLPDFPLQALPPWWRTWVSDTAHTVGAPADYLAQAVLASVAGLCGGGVQARVTDSWSEPCILWLALVGGPSSGKTAALEALRRALAGIEKQMAAAKREPTIVDRDKPLPQLLAAARPRGALLWRDGAGAWLKALACNGRGQPQPTSPLLDAWSPLRTALGPGSPAVSMIGGLDPARLDTALLGGDDGRAARFLYAWPRPQPYRSFLKAEPLRESEAVSALQRILNVAGDPARPLELPLRDEALHQLDGQLERLHPELIACEGVEAAWLGKGRRTIVRLALALALLDWAARVSATAPQPVAVTGENMAGACRLWDHFRAHARAVLGRAYLSDGERLRRRLLSWIRAHGAAQISREDVRRDALGQALNAEQTLQLIRSFERAGYLRQVAYEAEGAGRPPLRWDVNPVLIGGAAAEIAGIAEIRLPDRELPARSCS